MNGRAVVDIARTLIADGKGLIAIDESNPTCKFKSRAPWALTFSFARAIQQPALEIWRGHHDKVVAAQQALFRRVECNQAARLGEYNAQMETT